MMSNNGKPLVLYFGTVQRSEFYAGLIDQGVELGLLLDEDNPHKLVPEEFSLVDQMRFADGAAAICDRIRKATDGHSLECVINIDETLVLLWSRVCTQLGLPTITPAAAEAVRSKSEMRRRFAEHIGLHASARSRAVANEADAAGFAAETGYPVIIKPSNLWGSYFVSRCETPQALTDSYRLVAQALPRFCEEQRVRDIPIEILVEEFLVGTNHSVECLVLGDQVWPTPVIDVVTGADLGDSDFHHFARVTATCLEPEAQEHMKALACEAVRALGVDRGVFHVEFVYGPEGPRLLEVGGRPGGNRATLLKEAFGINIIAGLRDVLRGAKPRIKPSRCGAAAIVTPYPRRAGILRAYAGLDQIEALPSVARTFIYKKPGDAVQPRKDGATSPLRIEMRADTPQELTNDLQVLTNLCEDLFETEEATL
jgi:biotin carboxylase